MLLTKSLSVKQLITKSLLNRESLYQNPKSRRQEITSLTPASFEAIIPKRIESKKKAWSISTSFFFKNLEKCNNEIKLLIDLNENTFKTNDGNVVISFVITKDEQLTNATHTFEIRFRRYGGGTAFLEYGSVRARIVN